MTAATATVHHITPTPADVFGIDHPHAARLATQLEGLPPEHRREVAARAAQDRKADLALYVTLYAERYGRTLNLAALEAADELLGDYTILAIA